MTYNVTAHLNNFCQAPHSWNIIPCSWLDVKTNEIATNSFNEFKLEDYVPLSIPVDQEESPGALSQKSSPDAKETIFKQFLQGHQQEISDLIGYTEQVPVKMPCGSDIFWIQDDSDLRRSEFKAWKLLGCGVSKCTFSHPELPDYVVKIPRNHKTSFWRHDDSDLRIHTRSMQEAKKIIKERNYQHLVVPEVHFMETKQKKPLVIEERLDRVSTREIPDSLEKDAAGGEFWDFVQEAGICDINIGHNADFLQGSDKDPKIGLYDLDCQNTFLLNLEFRILLRWDKFEEAIDAAKDAFASERGAIRGVARLVFEDLFDQGYGFEEAIDLAKVQIGNPDRWKRDDGLKLFKAVLKHGRGFPEAREVARAYITNPDAGIQATATSLLMEIVNLSR